MALVDRYDLVELLGAGSFGQVFRALDRLTGRTVAIKVLHRQDDDARRRFHSESWLPDRMRVEHPDARNAAVYVIVTANAISLT